MTLEISVKVMCSFFPPLVENVASETSNEVESKKEEEGERVVEGGGEEGEVFCTLLVAASLHSIEVELYKVREGGREGEEEREGGGREREGSSVLMTASLHA